MSLEKKKICYITTISSTLESFIFPIAEYILEHTNWEIYMICSDDDSFRNKLPKRIHYIPIQMKRGISLSGIKAMFQMKKVFQKEKFDLIQYSTPNASLYAALAGKLAKIPTRLYCQWGIAYVGMHGIKRKIFKLEEKFVCGLSTWIEPDSISNLNFAHSEGLYLEEMGSVLGNGSACGVNLKKFDINKKGEYRKYIREKYQISSDKYVFGYVGRINRDKGINELLAAFKKLLNTYKDIYLMIVGNMDSKESLDQELYKWSKDCKQVIYTGSTNVVEQYLSVMDCYILPSYREGFGMGTIEAEAMALPVIVTDIPGPIDAMIPNVTGLTVEVRNVESLYTAMKKMYLQPDKSYGVNGLKFVTEKFEQKHLAELILEDRKRLLDISL